MTGGLPCGSMPELKDNKKDSNSGREFLNIYVFQHRIGSFFLFFKVCSFSSILVGKGIMLVARCVLLVTFWLLVFALDYTRPSMELSDGDMNQPSDCVNCTICQYPCHHHHSPPSLPPGGYPLYGVPPPPQQSGYPSYGAPPPPPPPVQAGENCPQPQTPGMQTPCCNPPPGPITGPLTGPPSPYTYVPFNNYAAASPLENSLYFFVMLGLAFAVVF